ncbi:unnamed protein product, partial [Medioppia subpectinata]
MNDMLEAPILDDQFQSPIVKAMKVLASVVDAPVEWIRHNVVEKYRGPSYPYYHERFRRVPTIDQCYTDDQACIYEANRQYQRDKKVDENIINILRHRFYTCVYYQRNVNEYYNHQSLCPKEKEAYKQANVDYFIKYGDLGPFTTVIDAFNKQKHRLIFERREAEGKIKKIESS